MLSMAGYMSGPSLGEITMDSRDSKGVKVTAACVWLDRRFRLKRHSADAMKGLHWHGELGMMSTWLPHWGGIS